MAQPLIEARNFIKTYQMGEVTVQALRGVDFTLQEREMVVVLGPSGSGKSTLLNIVGGMDTPTEGELYFDGYPLHNASPRDLTFFRRHQVGFVFQFFNLMPNLTAWENINLAVQLSKDPLDINELLGQVGLTDRADHFPSQLSGGEQQRVAIARGLAKNPRMVLCDEPTGSLDLASGIQVLRALQDFAETYQKTVVIITHNSGIAHMANRVIHLKDGKVEKTEYNPHPIAPERVTW